MERGRTKQPESDGRTAKNRGTDEGIKEKRGEARMDD